MLKKRLHVILIISIFISFYLFLKVTDISESIRLIQQLGINVIFILFSTFLAYACGTLGWRYCIDSDAKPSFSQLFIFRHVGNTISIFNPAGAITGEIFNAKMLIREGVENQVAYKSVLLGRIIMILSQLVILLVVLVWFLIFLSVQLPDTLQYAFYICFAFFMIVISALIYLLLKNGESTPCISEKKWIKFLHRIKEMRNSLAEYIHRRPKMAVLAFITFIAQWVIASLELYFILRFLGYNVNVWDGLFMDTVVIVSKSAFWFIPGQLGAEELINKFVLFLIGINSFNLWLTVSILRRARLLFWSAIAGIFYLGLKKKKKIENSGSIICES